MRTGTTHATSIHKVRREVRGGKRGDGHRRNQRIRRADPTRIHAGRGDPTLTGAAGLASFGVFCREKGVDGELRRRFRRLKSGPAVVYPMEAQLRMLLDSNVAGEARVLGSNRSRPIHSSSVSLVASFPASIPSTATFADSMTRPSAPWKN